MDFQHFAPQIDKLPQRSRKDVVNVMFWNAIRDSFTLSTWLAIGAVVQGLLVVFVRPTFAVAPAALVLLYRLSRTMLQSFGVLRNPLMDEILMGKFSVQIGDEHGNAPTDSAQQQVAVIMLGARSNHPLGIFGPGFKQIGDYFGAMIDRLNADEDSGFLGSSTYICNGERLTANGVMTCCYFRTVEDIHRFAHEPLHREAWDWWNNITATHPHLCIMHELYDAPKKGWENIFVNYHRTGIANIKEPVIINGREYQPIANASRGPLATQKGRLAQPKLGAYTGKQDLEKQDFVNAKY
ncbi:hypothetical protein M441DRAFT_58548 [Trichoderma asperellum CBS 433.97]|uniref:Uncharacterized protein n=1 Tax=Trichoderma asperellum (strain ATCC 204424 / CBS 433.97 / NBRC 101777) TaxID=1042311 RepID=A0A2T3Z8H5_TRIA4|nr:hypothetical protein M441DRAFT_58548 [Trichoderma asperellum CBS 433.97]PTB41113.1 hypothetical protein M441DRAFT_58548 [Trichoderma asperellum CBS 433.97]